MRRKQMTSDAKRVIIVISLLSDNVLSQKSEQDANAFYQSPVGAVYGGVSPRPSGRYY